MTVGRILIIDDDREILRRLSDQFTRAGYEVQVALDGELGMVAFNACQPDVVLTDIIMPNREGIETILEMRQARSDVKIIAMSGGARGGPYDLLSLARTSGADTVIVKPFRFAELLQLVAHTRGADATTSGGA